MRLLPKMSVMCSIYRLLLLFIHVYFLIFNDLQWVTASNTLKSHTLIIFVKLNSDSLLAWGQLLLIFLSRLKYFNINLVKRKYSGFIPVH